MQNRMPPPNPVMNMSSPLASGIVGYWTLSEAGGKVANNLAEGATKDATLSATGGVFTASRNGPVVHCDQSVFPVNADSTRGCEPPLTLAAWCSPESVGTDSIIYIGLSQEIGIQVQFPNFQAMTEGNAGNVQAVSTTIVVANTWYFVAGVFASATSRKIYVNGRFEAENTTSSTSSGASKVRIGDRNLAPGQRFPGLIGNAAIWGRALSDTEISYLYANPWTMLVPNQPRYASLPAIIPTPTGANPVARFDRIRSRRTSW